MPYGGTAPYGGGVGGGGFGGGGASMGVAPAGKVLPEPMLSNAARQSIVAERAGFIAELQQPQMTALLAAALAEEQGSVEGQKDVLESLLNRAAAHKLAGTYKSMYAELTSGFYGPVNRGQVAADVRRGISPERIKQTQDMLASVGAGRDVLRGLTDQGMRSEIKGPATESRGEFYGMMPGLQSQYQTAAYKGGQESTIAAAYQKGGIALTPQLAALAERGPEAVLPLSGARGLLSGLIGGGVDRAYHLTHSPVIHIHGDADEEAMGAMTGKLRDAAMEFINNFKAAQRHERRLSYESGYGS